MGTKTLVGTPDPEPEPESSQGWTITQHSWMNGNTSTNSDSTTYITANSTSATFKFN